MASPVIGVVLMLAPVFAMFAIALEASSWNPMPDKWEGRFHGEGGGLSCRPAHPAGPCEGTEGRVGSGEVCHVVKGLRYEPQNGTRLREIYMTVCRAANAALDEARESDPTR